MEIIKDSWLGKGHYIAFGVAISHHERIHSRQKLLQRYSGIQRNGSKLRDILASSLPGGGNAQVRETLHNIDSYRT